MSTIKGSTTINYIQQGDTITCSLRSTKPLQQFVAVGTFAVSPSFNTVENRPCIYPVIRSSLKAQRLQPVTNNFYWFYNITASQLLPANAIQFDGYGLSLAIGNIAAGTFKSEIKNVDGFTLPTLTIMKNLASQQNIDSDNITFRGLVTSGFQTTVSASIEFRIEQTDGAAYIGYISAGNGGVIDSDTRQIVATAHLMVGGVDQNVGVTYAWYKSLVQEGLDGWTNLNVSTQTLTINANDVDGSELFKCVISYNGKSANAILEVVDETDPMIIVLSPKDAQGNIIPEQICEGVQTEIIYHAKVVKRDSGDTVSGYTFYYVLVSTSGDVIDDQDGGSTFTVTLAHCREANGNVTLNVSAEND